MISEEAYIEKAMWYGIEAYTLKAAGYEAVFLPGEGANLIQLDHKPSGASLLKKPSSLAQYRRTPFIFGIPVLFPPNRISNGILHFEGAKYCLPINEPDRNNHLHGFLSSVSWCVSDISCKDGKASISAHYNCTENTEVYSFLPFLFSFTLRYTLSEAGLEQQVIIRNNDKRNMPLLLGFHTTFNIPFIRNSNAENCTIRLSCDRQWFLDERNLPTGSFDTKPVADMASGIGTMHYPLDHHFKASLFNINNKPFNGAIIKDELKCASIVYEVSDSFKHWMVYNGLENRKDFICPEPQTCMVNAPNLELPPETTGLITLYPGMEWSADSRIYITL